MDLKDPSVQEERKKALSRIAIQAINEIEDMRAAKRLLDSGRTQREIAEILMTNQPKIHRILKFIERKGGVIPKEPEEIILRATAGKISRQEMLNELKSFTYTFGTDAPYPHEGHVDGTWDQVTSAYARGLLSKEELSEIESSRG